MPVLALNGPTTASKPDGPSNSSWGRKDMSSSFGVSDGLSAVCKSSTCTRQMRDQLLAASSVASRGLVASPCAACLGHQAALGFVRRCNKPAAPWEALPVTLVQLVQQRQRLTSWRTCNSGSYRDSSVCASFTILRRCVRSLSICSGCCGRCILGLL